MENSQLFQLLAKHLKTLVEQVPMSQAQVNQQLWEQVANSQSPHGTEYLRAAGGHPVQPSH